MDDKASFEAFVLTQGPSLFRTAWMLCHNRHTAEDLVQEALARVYPKWGKVYADNPVAYARTTLVRLHISAARRRASSEVVSDELDGTVDDGELETRLVLHRALAELSAVDRSIVVLRHLADLPVRQVAIDLRMSEQAVRARCSRAVARLRERLGADFLVLTP